MSDQNLLDFHFHKDNSHHHHNNSGSTFIDPYSATLQLNYAIPPPFTTTIDQRKFLLSNSNSNNNNNTIPTATNASQLLPTTTLAAAAAAATQSTYDRTFYLPPINAISNEHENILPFISLLKQQQQQQQQQQQWKEDDIPQMMSIKADNASSNGDLHSTTSSTEDMPSHIVSPEAIREAQKEETEEALGKSQSMPFSAFPSFTSLKQQRRLSQTIISPMKKKKFNIPFSPLLNKNEQLPYYVHNEDESEENNADDDEVEEDEVEEQNEQEERDEDEDDEDEEEEEEEDNFPKTPQVVVAVATNNKILENHHQQHHRSQEKLKRPPNAYLLFNRDMRRKLLKQSPKMTVAEISKVVGDWWKALPDDQRQYYVKEASLLKEEHLKKYPDFIYTRRSKAELAEAKKLSKLNKRSSTLDQSAEIKEQHEESPIDEYNHFDDESNVQQQQKKRRRKSILNGGQRDPRGRKKKRHKHPYAPKHPMSAYLYYLAEVYPQVSLDFPGSTVGPISKSISKTWHSMTPQQRLPWVQKAESDKARYAREMQVYMATTSSAAAPESVSTGDSHNLEPNDGLTNNKVSDDEDDSLDGEVDSLVDEFDIHQHIKIGNGTTSTVV